MGIFNLGGKSNILIRKTVYVFSEITLLKNEILKNGQWEQNLQERIIVAVKMSNV